MAIRAGLDLAKLVPWLGALILATLAYYIVKRIVDVLDVSILGAHPFRAVGNALESGIVEPLNDVRSKSDAEIAKALSSLVDNLAVFLGLFLVLGLLVKAALSYLWGHALRPLIHSITDPIRVVAHSALAKVVALTDTVADNVVSGEKYAHAQAESAFESAKAWSRTEIDAAKAATLDYADDPVANLPLPADP